MMTTIPSFQKGQKLRAADLQALAEAVRANRVLPGAGIRITGSPNGTTIAASLPRRAGAVSPSLHKINLEDLIPNPFTIIQEVLDDLMDEIFAAFPTATDIAAQISGVVSNTLLAALPSAAQIASAIASTVTAILSGSGSGSGMGSLFNALKEAAPSGSAFATAILSLFNGVFAIIDNTGELVDTKLQQYSGLGEALTSHFAAPGVRQPRPGDYLYTEEAGILYTLFPVNKEGVPSANILFRVHFRIGQTESEPGELWCALTTFPAPDLAALCRMLARMMRQLIIEGVSLAGAAASASLKGAASTVAETAARLGEGGANGVGTGILGAMIEVPTVTPAGTGLLIKTFPTPIPTGDITELVYAIASDGRQVAIRVFPTSIYSNQLLSNAYVVGSDGRQLTLTVLGVAYGEQLFEYPTLVGTDGQGHTVGVFGDLPGTFTPDHQISYIGSDGQVWNTPHLFASTEMAITRRAPIKFIGVDGQGYVADIIYYTGSQLSENLTAPEIHLIDTAGHDRKVRLIGSPTDNGDIRDDLLYLDNLGYPMKVKTFLWNGVSDTGVTQENIEVCVNGVAQTKNFLIAPP